MLGGGPPSAGPQALAFISCQGSGWCAAQTSCSCLGRKHYTCPSLGSETQTAIKGKGLWAIHGFSDTTCEEARRQISRLEDGRRRPLEVLRDIDVLSRHPHSELLKPNSQVTDAIYRSYYDSGKGLNPPNPELHQESPTA